VRTSSIAPSAISPSWKRSEGKPDQAVDVKTKILEHAFDLAVFAFAQCHRHPAIGALHAIKRCLDARVMHAIQRQTFGGDDRETA